MRRLPRSGVDDRRRIAILCSTASRLPLYSDLLLHDVGTGDGIEQAAAKAGEIRTPALWGLRFRRPLLHDGSAATAEDAILRHAKEASGSTEKYRSSRRRSNTNSWRFSTPCRADTQVRVSER